MKLSTRNQLSGTVTGVKLGTIMSEITVDIGGQTVVAAITRGSAEELGLAEGDRGHRPDQGDRGDAGQVRPFPLIRSASRPRPGLGPPGLGVAAAMPGAQQPRLQSTFVLGHCRRVRSRLKVFILVRV